MNGIHQRIESKLTEIASANATLQADDATPAESHDAFERLPRLKKELQELCAAGHVASVVAFDTARAIEKLNASPVKSAELQLAIRDLETAGFRLRQHLGPAPEPSKPAKAGAPVKA